MVAKIQELFQLYFTKLDLLRLLSLCRAQLSFFTFSNFLGLGCEMEPMLMSTLPYVLFWGSVVDCQLLKDKILPSINTLNLCIELIYGIIICI